MRHFLLASGVLVILLFGIVAIYLVSLRPPAEPKVTLLTENGPAAFVVEVADDSQERQQGLMFRTELGPNRGMLFIFDQEEPQTFWMKNTLIPLDMVFISSAGTVVSVQRAIPCEADPCQLYPSGAPAIYVLEIAGGLADQLGIVQGTAVTFSGGY